MDNKRKRSVLLLVLLGASALGAGAYLWHDAVQTKLYIAQQAKAQEEAQRKAEEQRRAQQEVARSLRDPGSSPWLKQRLTPLWNSLMRWQPRLVIVPPGNVEDKPGLDLTSRIAFGRALADSLSPDEAKRVADPGFVLSALGEPRTIDVSALTSLALAGSQAESVVTGTVQREGTHILLKLERTDLHRKRQRQSFEKQLEVDPLYPEPALVGVAPEAMRALGFTTTAPTATEVPTPPALVLPASPLDAVQEKDALTGIWLQQLFGVLHTRVNLADPRPRERVFERSLWSVSQLAPSAADRAVLEARALAYLGRRKAALSVLRGAAETPEARALGALLNANLTDLEIAMPTLRRPIARLISELELQAMRQAAGATSQDRHRADVKRLAESVPQAWQPLVALYGLSFDVWDYPSPVATKQLLERDFPVAGYELKDLVLGKAALGSSPYDPKLESQIELSPLVHARKWREQHVEQLCCATAASRATSPSLGDYLDLVENTSDALVVGRIIFLQDIQGTRDAALATIKAYDDALFAGGHPGLRMRKGEAYNRRSGRSEHAFDDSETFEAVRRVMAWTPYQSPLSAWALRQWRPMVGFVAYSRGYRGRYRDLAPAPSEEPLFGDIPAKSQFLFDLAKDQTIGWPAEVQKDMLLQACSSSVYEFDACNVYAYLVRRDRSEPDAQRLDAALAGRFAGYAQATLAKVARLRDAERVTEAEGLLQAAIKTSSSSALYFELGDLLSDKGEFERSAKAYLAYPELARPGSNTVGLSNYLVAAAGPLLGRGAGDVARPLVESAAAFQDGSRANLQAQVLTALWRNDGEQALEVLRSIYQRYPNPRTLSDIASLTFLLGDPQGAWTVIAPAMESDSADFNPFAAALVGLRRTHADAAEVLARIGSGRSPDHYYECTVAAFRLFAMDRSAASLDGFFPLQQALLRKSRELMRERMPNIPFDDSADVPLLAAARGYHQLRQNDPAAAAAAFGPFLQPFQATGEARGFGGAENFWSFLPYATYALVKSGRLDEAKRIVERLREKSGKTAAADASQARAPEFDSSLVRAVVAALANRHADALRELRQAQAHIPQDARARLIPDEYELAQIAEWLARDTGNRSYLTFALSFARAYRLYDPWAAWTYGFEAQHTADESARVNATATALWLDPASERLRTVPAAMRAKAAALLKKSPPFQGPEPRKRAAKA